jgi:hypothetical protein
MAHGTWHMAHGTWHMAHGTWHMAHGTWHMAHGTGHRATAANHAPGVAAAGLPTARRGDVSRRSTGPPAPTAATASSPRTASSATEKWPQELDRPDRKAPRVEALPAAASRVSLAVMLAASTCNTTVCSCRQAAKEKKDTTGAAPRRK